MMLLWSSLVWSVFFAVHAVPIPRPTSLNLNTNGTYESDKYVCLTDDILYRDGDNVPTSKFCDKCICRAPDIICSPIKCEKKPGCRTLQRSNQCCPEYKCECERDGRIYNNGEKLESPENPCEVCYCRGGEFVCTLITCYKRDDCQPQEVPGRCCPKYDHCPPIMDNRDYNHQTTIRPTILTTSSRYVTSSLSTNSVHGRHPSHADYDTTTNNRFQLLDDMHPDTQAPVEATTIGPAVTMKTSLGSKHIDEEAIERETNADTKNTTASLPEYKTETTKYDVEPKVELFPVTTEDGSDEIKFQETDHSTSDTKELETETEEINDQDNVAESSEHSIVQVTKYPEIKEGVDNETVQVIEKVDKVALDESTDADDLIVQSSNKSSEEIIVYQESTTLPETRGGVDVTEKNEVTEESETTEPNSILIDDSNSTELKEDTTSIILTSVSLNSTTPVTLTSEPWEHHRPTQMVTDDILYVTTLEPLIGISDSKATIATTEATKHNAEQTETIISTTTRDEKLGENYASTDISPTENSDNETTTETKTSSETTTSNDENKDINTTMRYNRLEETDIEVDNKNGTEQSTENSITEELKEQFTTINSTTEDIRYTTSDGDSSTESSFTDSVDESTTISQEDVDYTNETTTDLPGASRTEVTNRISSEISTVLPDGVDLSVTEINQNKDEHLTTDTNEERNQLPVLKLSEEMTHHQMDFVIHHISMPIESDEVVAQKWPTLESVTENEVSLESTTNNGELSDEVFHGKTLESVSNNTTVFMVTNDVDVEETTDTPVEDVLKSTTIIKDIIQDPSKENKSTTVMSEETETVTEDSDKESTLVIPYQEDGLNTTEISDNVNAIEVDEKSTGIDDINTTTEQEPIKVTVSTMETINLLDIRSRFSNTAEEDNQAFVTATESILKESEDIVNKLSTEFTTEGRAYDEITSTKIEDVESTTILSQTSDDTLLENKTTLSLPDPQAQNSKSFEDKLADTMEKTTNMSEIITQEYTENDNTERNLEVEKLILSTVLPETQNTESTNINITEESIKIPDSKILNTLTTYEPNIKSSESETSTNAEKINVRLAEVLITLPSTEKDQDKPGNFTNLSDNVKVVSQLPEVSTAENMKFRIESKTNASSGIDKLIKFNEQFMSNKTNESEAINQMSSITQTTTEVTIENEGSTSGGINDNLAWVHLLGGKQQDNSGEKPVESSTFRENSAIENIENSTFFLITTANQVPTGNGNTRFLDTFATNFPVEYDDSSTPREEKREILFADSFGNIQENPGYFQEPIIYNSQPQTRFTNLQRDDAQELGKYDLALLQNFFKNLYIHDDRSEDMVS